VQTPSMFSSVRHTLGRSDEALKLSKLALWRARQLKHPFAICAAYAAAATLRYERREPEEARDLAEAAITVAEEHGFETPYFLAVGRSVRGWVLTESGQSAKGITELEANAWVPGISMQVSGMLAQVHLRAGRGDRAVG